MNLTLAITGASGSVFAQQMLQALAADTRVQHVNLVASESSLRVLAEELNLSGRNDLIGKLLGAPTSSAAIPCTKVTSSPGSPSDSGAFVDPGAATRHSSKITQHAENDIGASIASGSYDSSGMIVLPCSMGTLANIAHGLAQTLIGRAADVCLKERRPLILCVRETPFNKIHLRNMSLAADAGATIFPVIPTFYNHPIDSTEMARQFAFRVLAHIGLPQPDMYRWKAE